MTSPARDSAHTHAASAWRSLRADYLDQSDAVPGAGASVFSDLDLGAFHDDNIGLSEHGRDKESDAGVEEEEDEDDEAKKKKKKGKDDDDDDEEEDDED